jgi:hypothetical protein
MAQYHEDNETRRDKNNQTHWNKETRATRAIYTATQVLLGYGYGPAKDTTTLAINHLKYGKHVLPVSIYVTVLL